MTQCSCSCCGHGILEVDDRLAAYHSGYQAGVRDGHLAKVADEVEAMRDAADLLMWVRTRTLALAAEGENWADMCAGPKPGGDQR